MYHYNTWDSLFLALYYLESAQIIHFFLYDLCRFLLFLFDNSKIRYNFAQKYTSMYNTCMYNLYITVWQIFFLVV